MEGKNNLMQDTQHKIWKHSLSLWISWV